MLVDVLRHQPSTEAWRYVAKLGELTRGRRLDFAGHPAPAAALTPYADGFDADAAWLLAAADACPALRPPDGQEPRRLDTSLAEVSDAIARSALQDRNIALRVYCHPLVLNGWRCWQICVLVAGLLLDAARDGRGVRAITVEFSVGEEAKCAVVDDGVASPPRSRRVAEIDSLVAEMGGRVVRCSDDTGSAVVVRLPKAALSPAL